MDLDLLPPPETQAPAKPAVDIRVLTDLEIEAYVAPKFRERGVELPDPATSFILGAIKAGEVVGFQVVQLRVHADPMQIEAGHEDVYLPLIHAAERVIAQRAGVCDVFIFAPPGRITELAKHAGMQAEPWTVFSKRVEPEVVDIRSLDPEPITEAIQ